MKELDSFTVERLEEIRNSFLDRIQETAPSIEEVFALIDIALAAKRAEPALIFDKPDSLAYRRLIQTFEVGTKFYTTPQPPHIEHAKPVTMDSLRDAVAEMSGGLPMEWKEGNDKGHHAVPFINFNSLHRIVTKFTTPQLNSPEIPDGWKLVPIEPTQNMVDAHISGMQLAGFSRAYRDMLAAAPEPQNQQQNIPEIIPQGWIKCSDQMPESQQWGLVWAKWFNQQVLCWEDVGGQWTDFDGQSYSQDQITHWMPLPAAPEKP